MATDISRLCNVLKPSSFDLEFPLELDDEFWVVPGTPPTLSATLCLTPPTQPPAGVKSTGKSTTPPQAGSAAAGPSTSTASRRTAAAQSPDHAQAPNLIPAFTALIKLMKLLSFSLRTIYSINKSKVCQNASRVIPRDVNQFFAISFKIVPAETDSESSQLIYSCYGTGYVNANRTLA